MIVINEVLFSVVKQIFSNWTALKMAVENGMGTFHEAQAFCEYIVEFLSINDQLHVSDVSKELEGYFDDRFNTELQDGSSDEVAAEIMRFYGYFSRQEEALAQSELEKLSPLQAWINNPVVPRRSAPVNEDSSSDEESANKMVVATDDWVVVKTRKRN